MILIDDRLGSRDLVRHAPLDTLGELTRLDSADVAFAGHGPRGTIHVGVEAKKLSDLVGSLASGRLQATQVPAMRAAYDVAWVLSWGTYRCGDDGELEVPAGRRVAGGAMPWRPFSLGDSKRRFKYDYLEAALLTLSDVGVQHKHVHDAGQAARWLGVLYARWQRPWEDHRSLHTFDEARGAALVPSMDDATRTCAEVASRLPGLGFTRAVAAATYFGGCIEAMIAAPAARWAEVPGVGKVVSKVVVEAIRQHATLRERVQEARNDGQKQNGSRRGARGPGPTASRQRR